MPYELVIRSEIEDTIFTRPVAVRLAGVSLELLEMCEREELLRPRRMAGGGEGFNVADVRQMARIRRLQEDLGLDLEAIAVVLHMRRRMLRLLAEVESIERQMWQRERTLRAEIQKLRRRSTEEGEWR